jgi:hypothetical protein
MSETQSANPVTPPPPLLACRKCHRDLPPGQQFCPDCGAFNPVGGILECYKCTNKIPIAAAYCGFCGNRNPFSETEPDVGAPVARENGKLDFSSTPELSRYYREQFQRIYDSRESYQGKWNWAAFFWGAFWAFSKGLWAPVVLCIVVSIPFGGLPAIIFWAYFGARGNIMYYKKLVKKETVVF